MAFPLLASVALGAAGSLLKKQKSVTTDPMSAYTPEQRSALQGLMSLATSGSGLGINLGEAYGGSLGNFDMTGFEQGGLNKLFGLMSGSNPYLNKAADVFTNFANTKFNPDDPSSGFAAFSRQVNRATGRADDALNREAAITGNRFSTSIGRQKADLANERADSLQSELARLFQNTQSLQMRGAQGLAGLGEQQQSLSRDLLTLGGLERDLKNREAQSYYNEFLRQREEQMGRIGLAKDVTSVGLAPRTEKMPSAFSGFLSPIVSSAGTAIGGSIGSSMGDFITSIFKNK